VHAPPHAGVDAPVEPAVFRRDLEIPPLHFGEVSLLLLTEPVRSEGASDYRQNVKSKDLTPLLTVVKRGRRTRPVARYPGVSGSGAIPRILKDTSVVKQAMIGGRFETLAL
jgi:hypothetical protein